MGNFNTKIIPLTVDGYKTITAISALRDRAASFRVGGLKKNARRKIFGGGGPGGGHACGFLFNFSKVTENANNDKTIDFFPHLQ